MINKLTRFIAPFLLCFMPVVQSWAAGEIQVGALTTGATYYVVVFNASHQALTSGTTFGTYSTTRTSFAQAMSELPSGTGRFIYDFPAVTSGRYNWEVYAQLGGSAASTDQLVATGGAYWNGSGFGLQTGDAYAATQDGTNGLAAAHTERAAIKTKTDFLPSATAGAAGGVFVAGTNAATTITTGLTANITGNLSGSVGSVTGAVGSVTGAVGSVTGGVGGSVGSVSGVTFPTNFGALGIGAGGHITNVDTLTTYTGNTPQTGDSYARIGASGAGLTSVGDTSGTTTLLSRLSALRAGYLDNINNAALATEVAQTGDSFARIGATGSGLTSLAPSATALSTAVWTPTKAGFIDAAISGVSSGGVSAATIAGAVWDEARSGHVTAGTFGQGVASVQGNLTGTVSTLTTYTGNTPQTGDAFARIGATGSGLTSLAPSSTALSTAVWTGTKAGFIDSAISGVSTGGVSAAQIATAVWQDLLSGSDFSTVGSSGKLIKDDIDAATSSRMATYTQPAGFLAATFPGTVASPTNITAGTITTVTNLTNPAGDTSGTTTLLARLSAARAGYLDNVNNAALQTTIAQTGDSFSRIGATGSALTSLAQSSTALSTAVWTPTKAGFIDAAISGVSGGGGGASAATIAAAVWDEARSGHTTSGTYGQGVSSVQGNVTGSTGSINGVTFPANFAALGIGSGGHITNVDTLTTYTGNTPQSGDSFARIGANGAGLTALSTQASVNAISTVLGTPAHTTIAADIANVSGGGGSGGGSFLQRKIGPAHILIAKDGGDGNFGVIGTLHQQKGTGPITWAVELAGTQVPAGGVVDSMSAPTLSGADAAHATIGSVAGSSYGTNNTRLLFEFSLGSSSTTADVINITIPYAVNPGESTSIVIPVTVSN